jgi:hypothetical protein
LEVQAETGKNFVGCGLRQERAFDVCRRWIPMKIMTTVLVGDFDTPHHKKFWKYP